MNMRVHFLKVIAGSVLLLSSAAVLLISPASATSTWGSAQEVAATLNTVGPARVNAISCASAGNCSAGGSYKDSTEQQAFVINEVAGVWGSAQEVAGSLNTGHGMSASTQVTSISCASAGNCSAGGSYREGQGQQAFVIDEIAGVWGSAQEVAGSLNTGAMGMGGHAEITAIACASAGNCSASGGYLDSAAFSSRYHALVIDELAGVWGSAQEVAGNLNSSFSAMALSLSCASAGNCSAGGYYNDSAGQQAFVANEVSGSWGSAQEVAGSLNTVNSASIASISCASAGNCSAGGSYYNSAGAQAFVIDEVSGSWGSAQDAAGSLNSAGDAEITSISCASAGNCSAGGNYTDSAGSQVLVINEVGGDWGSAQELAAGLNSGNNGRVNSISCSSAGNCSAAGNFGDVGRQALVVDEVDGVWTSGEKVGGAFNTANNAVLNAISCASVGNCSTGGIYYSLLSAKYQAFVITLAPESAPASVPGKALKVKTKTTGSNVRVSWNAPSSDGGATIDKYQVKALGTTIKCTASLTNSCTLKKLKSTRSYTISIKAHNSVGWGAAKTLKKVKG